MGLNLRCCAKHRKYNDDLSIYVWEKNKKLSCNCFLKCARIGSYNIFFIALKINRDHLIVYSFSYRNSQ